MKYLVEIMTTEGYEIEVEADSAAEAEAKARTLSPFYLAAQFEPVFAALEVAEVTAVTVSMPGSIRLHPP
jgi:hypothetical protein